MKSKNETVIIVDDDLELSELLREFFCAHSYRVETLGNPVNIVEILKKTKGSPTVVLTDLNFPNDTGFHLIEKIKNADVSVPIIMMTIDHDVETAVKAIEAGAYDYEVKPLYLPQLLISVKRAMHFHQVELVNLELNEVLQTKLSDKGLGLPGVIGISPGILKVFDLVRRVAPSLATVFISGESGTGKEVIANAIHKLSDRKNKPFVAINCSAIPETLLETELFGHAKGAFTGASDKKIGLFETAEGGTLFLDEISDLTLPLQAKILRVLQERKIKRVGENNERDIDVRIVTATHKSMPLEISEKRFREDLYYRLNVIPVHIPPLRERKEDILPLSEYFLGKLSKINNVVRKKLSLKAGQYLMNQNWRGNVRELENALERALVLSDQDVIQVEDLLLLDSNHLESSAPQEMKEDQVTAQATDFIATQGLLNLEKLNDAYIQHVLVHTQGAKDEAAHILGIDRKTLYRKLAKNPSPDLA